jgi:Xaa-Pro aminopeptidase
MNPFLPASEFNARHARAAEAMQRRHLDALLVTAEPHIYYFSGHRPVVPWSTATRPTFCLVPADGEPVLIVHAVWAGGAAADSPLRDIRSFTETTEPPLAHLADCLKDRGLSKARIGMELGYEQRLGMSWVDYGRLQATLPGVEWVDGASALWDLRMIKSSAEIALMRRAGQITASAFDECFSRLAPGTTEAELASNLRAAIAARGAEFGFMAPGFVPEAYLAMSRVPGRETLQPGHLIWTDLGAIYGGYWSDFGRAAVIGQATDRQRRLWDGVHHITQAGVEAIGPGRAIPEVVEACRREANRRNLEMNFAAGRIGHGLGLTLTEPPHVAAYEATVLQPGMVITLEPGIVSPEGVYIVEQDIAVTETGHEVLSAGRWEIWEA